MSSADSYPQHIYFNAFNLIPQIGSVRFRKLLNYFPDLQTAWNAKISELQQAGLEENIVTAIQTYRNQLDPEEEFKKLAAHDIQIRMINDDNYPKLLQEIPNPPIGLYLKGEMSKKDEMAIAVVGSRKFSDYGRRVTQDLARDLVRSNLTVVSGLALGIDAIAHRTAIEFSGRTLAVLACGLDSVYPASNRIIAEQILDNKNGAIISELPLGVPPLKHHFPNRNRIISGLCFGTVVIEAAEESGALITARHALEQNRQVFAVPGPIYNPGSAGPNNLLKMGARAVTNINDILEELNLNTLQDELTAEEIVGDNEQENTILALLDRQPVHVDEITKRSSLPASQVAATLTIMEMKGKVRNLGANQYVIRK